MDDPNLSLWAALGSPDPLGTAPRARCPTWRAAQQSLTRALIKRKCFSRVRSWQGLWPLLHTSPLPSHATWQNLCLSFSVQDLITALALRAAQNPLSFTFWNVRWLVSPHTDAAIGKRGAVCNQILRGTITALVETHWTSADADLWSSAFPTARVLSAPAWGERRGGVALIIPQRYEIISSATLVSSTNNTG